MLLCFVCLLVFLTSTTRDSNSSGIPTYEKDLRPHTLQASYVSLNQAILIFSIKPQR